ncbi:Uncharacterized protein BP5553_03574 [Venustampulla echinocandica]|uniref:Rhodanese domain-containing protein n=1 Tax=Venustampulla echinocandica TaxID=2656787 RepID=A0A370TUN6_9HELO|nr:Uncharacterized protein BP5553_03574 [Venustampulla echinocandica]RDL39234.1 Uncharacterized protein BP5553_03574 [Venustampulla echinocandica]
MKSRRLPSGYSDPVSFSCTCPASSNPSRGLVLLFYRYFTALPPLPGYEAGGDSISLAAFHTRLTQKYSLGGKIRIATEGFNVTVGGTKEDIEAYMKECITHWSFQGLDLDTEQKQRNFFKPTPGGCACAFGGLPASVRISSEITPMGVTNYVPKEWGNIETLSPEEFHERCHTEANTVLLDVRNHYESRIGYFVDPRTGQPALRPLIRRFSQWPQYVRKYMTGDASEDVIGKEKDIEQGRQILTFCTGGIRCEKAARYMQENMSKLPGDKVCNLKGGIASYIMWMDEEIRQGRKRADESLFKGRNFVFDARGSTALEEGSEPVSTCHDCGISSDRLSKCRSKGCHLVLVVCSDCEDSKDPRCCQSCLDMDISQGLDLRTTPRPVCTCEKEREAELWDGAPPAKLPKSKSTSGNKARSRGLDDIDTKVNINIKVNTID